MYPTHFAQAQSGLGVNSLGVRDCTHSSISRSVTKQGWVGNHSILAADTAYPLPLLYFIQQVLQQ